jgi:hypothetical protein
MSSPDTATLRLLLLHQLPESEARQLEERLMLEEQLGDLLREAEHDLLDDYASNRLLPEERAAVEQYLLVTAEDRERLKVARALARLQARPQRARSGSAHSSVIPAAASSETRSPATRPWRPRRWAVHIGLRDSGGRRARPQNEDDGQPARARYGRSPGRRPARLVGRGDQHHPAGRPGKTPSRNPRPGQRVDLHRRHRRPRRPIVI